MKLSTEVEPPSNSGSWSATLKEKLKPRIIRYVAAGMVLILVGGIGYYNLTKPNAYAVMVGGKQIAYIGEEGETQVVLDSILSEKGEPGTIRYLEEINYEPVRVKSNQLADSRQLKRSLEKELSFVSAATAIVIDGVEIGVVENIELAEEIIETVKAKYLPQEKDGLVLLATQVEENVQFVPKEVGLEGFTEPEILESLIVSGTEKMETYQVVKGDSLWSIARKNNLTVEDLKAANQLKSELLSIGQELKLIKAEPMLHLVATYSISKKESIPFKVKYEASSSLYVGQEQTKKSGVSGQKEVQYRVVEKNGLEIAKEIMAEKVLKEPVEGIVSRGTKAMIASRGDGGSGELAWPIQGVITSSYGKRGSGFHAGLDIGALKGTPIGAAEAGTVTFTGRSGNYGLLVVVDHGDGVATYYAHCSEIKAKIGDEVTRGQVIALVGSTGRSTGPHLHFEVRINGNHTNPINYLR